MSPVYYILISMLLTNVILAVVFATAWRCLGRDRHTLTWALTFSFATVQWVVNLCRPYFESFQVFWILVSAITLVVTSLGLLGHLQRTRQQFSLWQISIPAIAALLMVAWFTIGWPHSGIRTAITPIYASITLGISAWVVIRFRKQPTAADFGAAAIIGAFGVLQLLAGLVALTLGTEPAATTTQIYYHLNFVGMPAAYTGMGLFVVLMIASDIAEQLREVARQDQLTGLQNRRGFGEQSALAYASARRESTPVAIIMADIDHFKAINDSHGHQAGDEALRHFSNLLARKRRTTDIVGRVGGEEFALILPGADLETAIRISSELCDLVNDEPANYGDQKIEMTASFGVAALSVKDTCMTDAITRADAALYRSKQRGRNRIDLQASQVLLNEDGRLIPVGSS